MARAGRTRDSYRRREPQIEPRESLLLVCEGEKTEPNYFRFLRERLRLASVEVEIDRESGGAPISVVDRAIELRERRERNASSSTVQAEYDMVYCIMDVEAPLPHPSLDQAIDKAKGNGLVVILSNPCFEYWYLLHFEKTATLMNSNDQLIRALKDHVQSYTKGGSEIHELVFPKTDDAIRHATQIIREKMYGQNLKNCNPSTHVHRVVKKLKRLSVTPRS